MLSFASSDPASRQSVLPTKIHAAFPKHLRNPNSWFYCSAESVTSNLLASCLEICMIHVFRDLIDTPFERPCVQEDGRYLLPFLLVEHCKILGKKKRDVLAHHFKELRYRWIEQETVLDCGR